MGVKKKVVAIVGNSGSGKTTIGTTMAALDPEWYNWVCSYTTRPMRQNEVNGYEHIFVTEDDMPSKDKMVAYANFGGYHYWTTFEQFDNDKFNVYIIDEDALDEMIKKHSDVFDIKKIYIERKSMPGIEKERIERDKTRTVFPEGFYDLYIINDAPSSPEFVSSGKKIIDDFLMDEVKCSRKLLVSNIMHLVNNFDCLNETDINEAIEYAEKGKSIETNTYYACNK